MSSYKKKESTFRYLSVNNAFTMIELLLVIVILGILAAYTTQMLSRDNRSEAINHILSMMRYTQNLALHDNKHDRNSAYWQRAFWRFGIQKCHLSNELFYYIGTDTDYSRGIKVEESAIDPSNGKFTVWYSSQPCPKNATITLKKQVSPNIFITKRYGISNVTFTNCKIYSNGRAQTNNSRYIGFDNYGRPMKGYYQNSSPNYNGHLTQDCHITFSFQDNSISPFTIVVTAESGYIYLQENPAL